MASSPAVFETLLSVASIAEAYEVTTFECYRNAPAFDGQMVTVKILDRGPDVEKAVRFTAQVIGENGKGATGKPMPTPEDALRVVHWYKLDERT